MLEGKELVYKLGDKGEASLDIDDKGFVELKIDGGKLDVDGAEAGSFIKADLLVLVEKAAASKPEGHWLKGLAVSLKVALGR